MVCRFPPSSSWERCGTTTAPTWRATACSTGITSSPLRSPPRTSLQVCSVHCLTLPAAHIRDSMLQAQACTGLLFDLMPRINLEIHCGKLHHGCTRGGNVLRLLCLPLQACRRELSWLLAGSFIMNTRLTGACLRSDHERRAAGHDQGRDRAGDGALCGGRRDGLPVAAAP